MMKIINLLLIYKMIHGGFKLKGKTYHKIKDFLKGKKKDVFYDSNEDNDIFYDATASNNEHIKTCAICWQPLGGPESIDETTDQLRTLTRLSCTYGHIVHTDDINSMLLRCPYDNEDLDPTRFKLLDDSTVIYSTETGGGRRRIGKKRKTKRTIKRNKKRSTKRSIRKKRNTKRNAKRTTK